MGKPLLLSAIVIFGAAPVAASVESDVSDEPQTPPPETTPADSTTHPAIVPAPLDDPPTALTPSSPATPASDALVAPSLDAVELAARREGKNWDLQVELAIPVWASTWNAPDGMAFLEDLADVYSFGNANVPARNRYLPFLVRGRAGFLVLAEPWYFGMGVTAQYDSFAGFAVGLQTEITHIWGGVWGQMEAAYSLDKGLLVTASAGYKLMGVELRALEGGRDFAVLAKVRIPLGLIIFVKAIYDPQLLRRRVKLEPASEG